MTWALKEPAFGDMIRVKAGSIWHYGIFVSDGEVIQFGPNPQGADWRPGAELAVLATDIDAFLLGGFLEVALLDRKESRRRRSASETVAVARSRIGERGYHILHNNCEHFVNECLLGEHKCSQVDQVRELFRQMPLLDVYVAEIPEGVKPGKVYPKERNAEISACSHERVRTEKYCVWRLLEYAVAHSFGKQFDKLRFEKTESGKWTCPELYFSLSHSHGLVAVAVSRKPVGVDVELIDGCHTEGLRKKLLNECELAYYDALPEEERPLYITERWTEKESEFKRSDAPGFCPGSIEVRSTKSMTLTVGERRYVLSVSSTDKDKLHLYQQIKLF